MQSKEKELVPGTEEPSIRILTPVSRLQVSLVQETLRETGWKYSDKFHAHVTSTPVRPLFKMVVYQARVGLKRSEVMVKLKGILGQFKEEKELVKEKA